MALRDFDPLLLEPETLDIAGDADGEDERSTVARPSGRLRVAVTLSPWCAKCSTAVLVWMVIPCLAKALYASEEIFVSSEGSMRSSISTTVTSAPSVR
jgi:hypothetical protein